jgi:DNA replication and repair protein RecF
MPALTRLTLTDFRSYASAVIEPGPGLVLLSGANGAGKTNALEAVSLLTPGRGLRGAALSEMARLGGSGAFAVAASLGRTDIGTGTLAAAPERRLVRVNAAPAAVNSLSEWLSVLWLTPAMDRLFSASAGERRRFLDRLVLALEPAHAHHSARYEAAMRARNKLLAGEPWDEDWLAALEAQMGEHGAEVSAARLRTVADLADAIDGTPDAGFPRAGIALDGWKEAHLAGILSSNRRRDAAAGRATEGPHRQDLAVTFQAKAQPAARSSTGEQKALLLGLVLAHADLVAERRGQPPVLLLDEVSAHLDPQRRAALFHRLESRGQVWMTATEAALFDGIASASRFHVEAGTISPA